MAMVAVALLPSAALACTSAIVSAEANPYGRPVLWKHRDTSTIDNKVEYIPGDAESFGYVALFNAGDKKCEEAWIGMNEAGFAVMNTASYNIKDDNLPESKMDKEGFVMTRALKTCRTVDDFEKLISGLPRPMGVEANFGVIDAEGHGAYFETNNHSYVKFDLKDAPGGVLVRTNYSHSGRPNEGYGHVREANANCLLQSHLVEGDVTPDFLTETLSRTFYHDGKKKDFTLSGNKKLFDEDFIPRYKSTCTVAIEGCVPVISASETTPGFIADQYIMWTGMGYPPVSEMRAVYVKEDGVPNDLRGLKPSGHSGLGDQAKKLRDEVFTVSKKGDKYIDLSKLYNPEGTGYAQQAIKRNKEVYSEARKKRDGK